MLQKVAFVAAAGLALASGNAFAATDSDTIAVSATITASCTITANPLAFGSLTSTATQTDVSTTVDVACTNESPFNVGIDYGLNATGAQRRMLSGANLLSYDVRTGSFAGISFSPVANYGNAANYNSSGTTIGTTSVPIYGVIPAGSTPPSGAYGDTLTVTVNY